MLFIKNQLNFPTGAAEYQHPFNVKTCKTLTNHDPKLRLMLMLYFLLRLADSCTVCVHGWMLSLLLDKYLALDYFVWFEMDYEKKK